MTKKITIIPTTRDYHSTLARATVRDYVVQPPVYEKGQKL